MAKPISEGVFDYEAIVFFFRSNYQTLSEIEGGLQMIKEFLGLLFQQPVHEYPFIMQTTLLLLNSLSIEGVPEPEFQTSILNFVINALMTKPLPQSHRIVIDTFLNLIKEMRTPEISQNETVQIGQLIFREATQLLATQISESKVRQQFINLEMLISGYLTLINRQIASNNTFAQQALIKFFEDFGQLFNNIESFSQENSAHLYLFLVFGKSIVDSFDNGTENEADLDNYNKVFVEQIQVIVKQIMQVMLLKFDVCLNSVFMKQIYYQTIRDIVKKFSDKEVPYFGRLLELCMNLTIGESEKLAIMNVAVETNMHDYQNQQLMFSNLESIDAKFFAIFGAQIGGLTLTKNEEFESEYVALQNTFLIHSISALGDTTTWPVKVRLILTMLNLSQTSTLKRECFKFM